MKLRRLVIQGYKSFATRTEFVFDGGITAIVGPNGSGKSNIADALRWVLGEQSYISLRSRRTVDMIFSGSDGRGRVGMAEASVILDNNDRWLPVDFQEVAITRRAYRSGENEYYLNGTRVRLRDINEILGEGGLDRLTYSVVGQGAVDSALSLSPTERRKLFEEAAGITVYQSKRDAALRRLEETAANVLRVNDIMHELEPQLQRLAAQAEQANRLSQLQEELKQLRSKYYRLRLLESTRLAEICYDRAEYTRLRQQRQMAELAEFESAVARLAQEEREQTNQIESWQREGQRLQGALSSVERQQAVLAERERALLQRQEEITRDLKLLADEIEEAEKEERSAREMTETLRVESATIQAEIQGLEDAETEARERQTQTRQEILEAQNDLARARATIAAASARQETARQRLLELQRQGESLQQEQSANREELTRQQEAMLLATRYSEQTRALLREAQESVDQAREEAHLARQSLLTAQREVAEVEERGQSLKARAIMLARIQQESYYPGVRAVLEYASVQGESAGIIGPVSTLLRVPSELESAVEAVLGSRLQQVVVQRWQDAEKAIAHLKQTNKGRVTFLPLETIRPSRPIEVPPMQGVLGVAAELLTIKEGCESILAHLLNRVIVVEDLRVARILLGKLRGSYTIATLAGETAQSSGSVTGGAANRNRSATLERERERRAIPAQMDALREQREQLLARKREAEQALAAANSSLNVAEETVHQRRAYLEEALRKENHQRMVLQQLEEQLRWQHTREENIARDRQTQADIMQQERGKERQAQERAENLTGLIQSLEAKLAAIDQSGVRKLELQRSRYSNLQERLSSAIAAHNTAKQRLQRLRSRAQERQEQACSLVEDLARLQLQSKEMADARGEYERALSQLHESIEPARFSLVSLQDQKQSLQKEERLRRQWHIEFNQRCNEIERAAERALDALAALEEAGRRDLGEEAFAALKRSIADRIAGEGEDLENLASRIAELERESRRLGNVNPNAPEEHAALLERYNFLRTQAQDLDQAARSLREVIEELEATMRERFLTTFNAVSKRFSVYFEELFSGGHCRLHLSDPSDVASTGVEITIRPPGKRRQDLALLSGGERALAAAALLFALLEVSKTPFCCMDEVDAMLDEANVGRFRRAMQALSQKIQFIVISHNRATIEAANIVYGVTMAEDGTSSVLSLKLGEIEAQLN